MVLTSRGGKVKSVETIAFSKITHNGIRFPMSCFLSAIYRPLPFTNGFAFVIFSSCFLCPMTFSLAAEHLQIAVHQVLLIDPAVDCSPAGHPQFTRSTGDLLWRPCRMQFFLYIVDKSPRNGTFLDDSRNDAAGTSSVLCVGSKLECRTCEYSSLPVV